MALHCQGVKVCISLHPKTQVSKEHLIRIQQLLEWSEVSGLGERQMLRDIIFLEEASYTVVTTIALLVLHTGELSLYFIQANSPCTSYRRALLVLHTGELSLYFIQANSPCTSYRRTLLVLHTGELSLYFIQASSPCTSYRRAKVVAVMVPKP